MKGVHFFGVIVAEDHQGFTRHGLRALFMSSHSVVLAAFSELFHELKILYAHSRASG